MRYFVAGIVLLCVSSCANKEKSSSSSVNDTIPVEPVMKEKHVTDSTHNPALDATTYIGYVNTLIETNEVYVLLSYTQEGFQPETDSMVYSDGDGIKRQRIAKKDLKAFALAGLGNITIYDERNKEVAHGELVRVELFDDVMSSQYIAVYKAKNFHPVSDVLYYGVGENASDFHSDFSYEAFDDMTLTKTLLTKLKRDTTQPWIGQHYRVMPTNTVYSTLSMENESLITEFKNEVKTLIEVKDDYHFDKILPLPFFKAGKPLMLISASVPETDVFWDGLAEYNEGKYIVDEFNRVLLSNPK